MDETDNERMLNLGWSEGDQQVESTLQVSSMLQAKGLPHIRNTVNFALKNTQQRVKCFNDPFLEEPHVKLFVIDMINYFLSLFEAEDR